MKITKSKLAQIIKEELEATTAVATNEMYLPFIGGKMHPDTLSWAQDQAKRAIKSARFMAEGEPLSVQEEVDYAIEDLEDATKRMEYYVSNRHKESEAERAQKRHDKALAAIRAVSSSIAQSSRDKRKLAQAAEMKKQAAADKRWKAGAKQRAHFAKRQAEIQMRDKEKFAKEWWYNNAGLGSQERASEKWDSVINSRDKDRFINGGGSELEWPMHAAKKSAAERKGRRMRENKITKSKLAQIIQEELSNTMSEAEQWKMGRSMKAADLAADPLYAAENQGIVDAQDDFARIQAGGKVLQIDTTEETEEEEIAYAQAYHDTMDRLKQNVADRKLYRPPEPEGEPDVQHYDGEFFQEGKAKITKTQLATIIKEELGDYPSFSNMESLLSKLLSSIEGLDLSIDYLAGSISGEDAYSAGANQRAFGRYASSSPALKENKMKITKSKLSKIIQEELAAMKTEGYGAYKRDDMSPHAKDMAKNRKKGYSPQAANTAIPGHEESYKAYWDSLNKKPKRGKKDLGEAEGRYEFELDPKVQQSVLDALAKSGTGALDFPLPLTPEQEKYYSHLDDGDRQSMLRDVVEELVELGKIKVADGLYYAVQRLEEDLAPYSGLEEYVIDALTELGGEDALGDIAHVAGRAWAASNWSRGDERIDEKDMFYSVAEALENLLADGRVRLTQGGPDSTDEDFYALA